MIKACFFDLDGTLLNTIHTIAYYANLTLEKFGIGPIDTERYKMLVGDGAHVLVERMLKEKGAYSQELHTKVYKYYKSAYDADPLYLTCPYEGIPEMISELSRAGIKLGVLSNKPDYAAVSVVRHFFGDVFDFLHGQRDGIPVKPDPTPLLFAMREVGAVRDETIYVGDTSVDIETGRRACVLKGGVAWGFRQTEELTGAGADVIFHRAEDIVRFISERCGMQE